MKKNRGLLKRIFAACMSVCLLLTSVNLTAFAADTTQISASGGWVAEADPGTAHTFETMLGQDENNVDGNRYAGRLWVDKSVYTDGQEILLNTTNEDGSTAKADLQPGENFQVVFSVLGSSMTTTETSSTAGPMDVVLILDTSRSMQYTSGGQTRLQRVVAASDSLIQDLLSNGNVRLGIVSYNRDSEEILALNSYANGVRLTTSGGTITARDNSGAFLGSGSSSSNTNLQAGIDSGMKLLTEAENTAGRKPVVIVLTDGAANHAVSSNWWNVSAGSITSGGDAGAGVTLSTLLNASYNKAKIANLYNTAPIVYGISVDLAETDAAHAIMNPGATGSNGFNSSNQNSNISRAYSTYQEWIESNTTVTLRASGTWTFAQLPTTETVTKQDVISNINYVDNYYDVKSAELEEVFEQISEELTSNAFNPITSSSTVEGGTGVKNTPLIFVDDIGMYMEVKNIQAVTLFGQEYGVTYSGTSNGIDTYTVDSVTGNNPTTGEEYNTSEDIRIQVSRNADGTQRLQIEINQEVLPIILEKVKDTTVGDTRTITIEELSQRPLRVYYTVGLDDAILLENGEIDVTKIQGYPFISDDGSKVQFYSNAFNFEVNNENIEVLSAKTHVGFKPSMENRYYYHPANQGIFTEVTDKEGNPVNFESEEAQHMYGVPYVEGEYKFTYLTYDDYKSLTDDTQVYTYVSFYRPTESSTDAANAGEEVTYIVYTDWGYLKESVAFYDRNARVFVNYDEANDSYATNAEKGIAIPEANVEQVIDAYKAANANADLVAMLGVGSLRTSRFHNMTSEKTENITETAQLRYVPEYTHDTAAEHHDNDVVVWLGNNGRLTVDIATGIALTKQVTEAIGDADATYALTVTVPSGVTASPIVKDATGNDITATASVYHNNVLTVDVKAGETVYISGIPAETVCDIGEAIPDNAEYYMSSKTATVTIPTVEEALNGADQYVEAVVTNAPKKYGNLFITKEIISSANHAIPDIMLDEEFAVNVHVGTGLAGETFDTLIEDSNGAEQKGSVTVDQDGNISVTLKARHSIEILNLPEKTEVTVTEQLTTEQDVNFDMSYRTRNYSKEEADDNNQVIITADANSTAVIINDYKPTPVTVDLDIDGIKNFAAEGSWSGGTFEFRVQKWNGTAWEDIKGQTKTVSYAEDETGTKNFTLENVLAGIDEYTQTGSWAYQVVEVIDDNNRIDGVTYDRTLYTFTVTVTDNNGQLVATVTDLNNEAITDGSYEVTFTNTYHTAPISIDIVKEVINESGDLDMDSKAGFQFAVAGADENWKAVEGYAPMYVYTDAAGEARLTRTYTQTDVGRIHRYIITEVGTDGKGWTYSDAVYRAEVEVTAGNDGNLVADMKITAVAETTADGETASVVNGNSGEVKFINTYDPDDASVNLDAAVKKNLEGRTLQAGEFTFKVYKDGSTNSADLLATGTNAADGSVDFDNTLTFEQVGKYLFDIVEEKGSLPGVTYDTTIYDLVVEVKNDATTGTLIAEYYFEDAVGKTVTFNNFYNATPTEYTIVGSKILHGRLLKAGEFAFELYEGTGENASLIDTVSNAADGTFTFKTIHYDAAGTYTYTIKEKSGSVAGVTYTGVDKPVVVTVTVVDNNAVLSASADKQYADIQFENTYKAALAHVTFQGTKTLNGRTLQDSMFAFNLFETDNTFNITGKTALQTKENSGDAFAFDMLTFDTVGTYYYVIAEDATNPIADVVYDRTQYRFRIQVADIGDGQLRASVLDVNAGTTSTGATLTKDVAFTNATFDEVTEKEVYLADDVTTTIDGQKVKAGDELTYYITYTNYTGQTVTAHIVDTIPTHTSYVTGSASHNGSYAGRVVTWNLSVAKGESVTVSFNVKVNKTQEIIANIATVRDGINTYYTNEVVNHTIDEIVEKDVFYPTDVNVSIDGRKVYSGDTLLYVVEYRNLDLDGADVTITDDIPKYTTYVEGSADNGGVYKDGTITWKIDDVPAWTIVRVAFQVRVDDNIGAETITNEADVTTGLPRFTTNEVTNYTVEDEVKKDVFAVADTKTSVDGKNVKAGEELLYTISYKNTGEEKATVVITDAIPQHTAYVEGSVDHSGVYKDGILTWNLDVEAGKTVVVSFKVKVNDDESATITNKAEIKEGKNSYITNEVTSKLVKETETVTPPSTPNAPKTGDTASTAMWSTFTFASLMVCGALIIIEKKRRNKI